jgi:hypothetical protein
MASETPKRVRMWSFRKAPPEFQRLFPEGRDSDWVAHVPESELPAVEPSLVQWRPVYGVRSVELKDRSVVSHGAPREALEMIAERGKPITGPLPEGQERRTAMRVQLECPSQYTTRDQMGFGHTIDMSRTGIAFTTEALLARDTEVTLRVTWPVRLEGGVPVQLYAVGKLARAEPTKAAMHMDSFGFSIET